MIDAPPENPIPVPPTKPHYFALIDGPAWLLTMPNGTLKRAQKLFGAEIGLAAISDVLKACAGAIYIGDPATHIPADCAKQLQFFFDRDGVEALVFCYRPFEDDFQAVTQVWLNARKRN